MSNYKCIKSFTSNRSRLFSYGSEISSFDYLELDFSERENFSEEYESSSGYTSTSTDYGSSDSVSSGIDIGIDLLGSSSSSDSGFGGFGGGDGGGGGADSSW